MLFRKTPRANLGILFDEVFVDLCDILRPHKDQFSFPLFYDIELFAFLYDLTFFYVRCLPLRLQHPVIDDLNEIIKSRFSLLLSKYFDKRQQFYLEIAKEGNIRNEWSLASYPNTPDFRMFVAFGDSLYNSSCIHNYSNAPIAVYGLDTKLEFNKLMLQVNERLKAYCESFKTI